MEAYRDWRDIAFLPVVNALIEERLQKIENIITSSLENHTVLDKIELWHQLCQLWKKWPNKTMRQIEWLRSLEHGIDSLKRQLFTAIPAF